jgi:hypothetical protein
MKIFGCICYLMQLRYSNEAAEHVWGLQNNLRMMGIKVDEPAFVFEDKRSLCYSTKQRRSLQ